MRNVPPVAPVFGLVFAAAVRIGDAGGLLRKNALKLLICLGIFSRSGRGKAMLLLPPQDLGHTSYWQLGKSLFVPLH